MTTEQDTEIIKAIRGLEMKISDMGDLKKEMGDLKEKMEYIKKRPEERERMEDRQEDRQEERVLETRGTQYPGRNGGAYGGRNGSQVRFNLQNTTGSNTQTQGYTGRPRENQGDNLQQNNTYNNTQARGIGKCRTCQEKNKVDCYHCFKCGSEDHFARGCRKMSGNEQRLSWRGTR